MTHFEKLPRSLPPISRPQAPLLHQPAPPPATLREDELDAMWIVRLIRRRIWLILLVGFVLTLAAIPPILAIERSYYAQSRLLIQQPLTSRIATLDAEAIDPIDLDTEIERLLSRDIAVRMIEEFRLDLLPEFNPSLQEEPVLSRLQDRLRTAIKPEPAVLPSASPDELERVVMSYYGALVVGRSGQSSVIEIGFSSRDPGLAADVPNRLVQVYLSERKEKTRLQVAAADSWMARRIDEQQARLAAAQDAIGRFRDVSGLAATSSADADGTVTALSARRAGIAQQRAEVTATLDGFQATDAAGRAAMVDSLAIVQLRRDLTLAESDLARLLDVYGDSYGAVIDARAKVREVEQSIAAEVDRFAQGLRTKAEALDREDATTAAALEAALARAARITRLEEDLGVLVAAADAEAKTLDLLQRQRRDLEDQGELPAAEAEVLSPASVPLYPQGRSKLLYLIGAMIAAGGAALTAAFIREILDNGVRSHQQLDDIAGIAPGGLIPLLPIRRRQKLPAVLRANRGGRFCDAVRAVALTLERSNGGRMPRGVLVTSALPNEGKSTIATALATELAAAGRKVLLVDADLRHGRLHQIFGGAVSPGLADFVVGEAEIGQVIHHDEASRVDYIPRGAVRNFASLEQEAGIAAILRYAERHDQVVIFDSAPVLATSETVHLSGLVDRTVLLVRWGRTTRSTLELAVQRLLPSSRADLTVAINLVNPRRHRLYGFRDAGLFDSALHKYYPDLR